MRTINIKGTLAFVAFFVVWEGVVYFGKVEPLFLPAPSAIAIELWGLILTGEIFVHLKASIFRASAGFTLAALMGIGHGILIAWSRGVEEVTNPLVELFRPIPGVALIPVAILWFGIGDMSKIVIIAFSCYFPIVLNTVSGVRQVDVNLLKVAKLFGASRSQTLTKVVLPSALPSIMTGLRISAGTALILLVVTEMIGAKAGIGALITHAEYTFRTERMFAGIFTIGVVGYVVNELMVRLERRLTPWKQEVRRAL